MIERNKIIGRLKFWGTRVRDYLLFPLGIVQLDTWIKVRGYSWWYILPVVIVCAVVIALFDKRFVYSSEAENNLRLNPEWNKKWDELFKRLDNK